MTPTKPGSYEFVYKNLVEVRNKLGFTQVEMAKKLGVPTTTLYRWETGATSPDAESLASIYSVAMENQVKPIFFLKRSQMKQKEPARQKLMVMWDFQNMPVSNEEIPAADKWLRDEVGKRFPTTTRRRFKAFSGVTQTKATDLLLDLNWKVWEDDCDMDDELIDQSRSECLQTPENIILVIISKDRDYSDLIDELKVKGVRTYLIAPKNASQKLIDSVGKKRWIIWEGHFPNPNIINDNQSLNRQNTFTNIIANGNNQGASESNYYGEDDED